MNYGQRTRLCRKLAKVRGWAVSPAVMRGQVILRSSCVAMKLRVGEIRIDGRSASNVSAVGAVIKLSDDAHQSASSLLGGIYFMVALVPDKAEMATVLKSPCSLFSA